MQLYFFCVINNQVFINYLMNVEIQIQKIENELEIIGNELTLLKYLLNDKNFSKASILEIVSHISNKLELIIQRNLPFFPNHN
jgi:hypothetical protein